MGMLCCLITGASGQTLPSQAASPSAETDSTLLQDFQDEQQALARSYSALRNPSPTQIQTWQQNNAARLQAQQQRARQLADDSALEPMPLSPGPNIPPNASPTLRDFLTTRSELAGNNAKIHNQLLNALPQEVTEDQIEEMRKNEALLISRQNEGTLQLQARRAQQLAEETARQQVPLPPPLVIPPGSTPQTQAFLTLRDQLLREQIQLHNQNTKATSSVGEAALRQWQERNAARFQQLQQLAISLSSID